VSFQESTMNRKLVLLAAIAIATALAPAAGLFHAGGWGGGGDRSSWSAHSWRGGTASGGDGSWSATGARGGTASGGGGSWSATGYRGGTASGGNIGEANYDEIRIGNTFNDLLSIPEPTSALLTVFGGLLLSCSARVDV